MTKALVTCAQHPGVYFLEKWLPDFEFVYGDTSFIAQILATQQVLLPKVSQADYIHELLNICLDHQIDAVFAMSFAEQELLSEATELFSEFNIQLCLPNLISRKLLFNPIALFEKLNFCVIKTVPFRLTSSFAEFSKACLQLGYPTETLVVISMQNPDLVWLVNDQFKTNLWEEKPVISFTKAAKIFTADETLLLKTFRFRDAKKVYASFIDGNLGPVWNAEKPSEENLIKIGLALQLTGLFEFIFVEDQLFSLQSFVVK